MIALNRGRGRRAVEGGMFVPADTVEFDEQAQRVLARIGGSICSFSPIDRVQHAKRVAAVAVDAKRHPRNPYAEATL